MATSFLDLLDEESKPFRDQPGQPVAPVQDGGTFADTVTTGYDQPDLVARDTAALRAEAAAPQAALSSPSIQLPTKLSETPEVGLPVMTEAMKLEQIKGANAIELKKMELDAARSQARLNLGLDLWKEARDDARDLARREMNNAEWERKYEIINRDKLIDRYSAARDVSWEFHGTFSGGRFTSSFSGTATNPYKDRIQSLLDGTGGSSFTPVRPVSSEPPAWLNPFLSGSGGTRKEMTDVEPPKPAEVQQPRTAQRRRRGIMRTYVPGATKPTRSWSFGDSWDTF